MAGWHIGVIGGLGLDGPGTLDMMQEIPVASAFGEPSGPVVTGFVNGVRLTYIARRGAGDRLSPGHVNYRANIDVLKRCGVTDVLAVSHTVSLIDDLAPGTLVAVDQVIDCTTGRQGSFFGEGIVAHVSLADPVCPRLAALAADAASAAGASVRRGATCLVIEGPQYPTRAECALYRQWGAQVVGMTAMPEARLAREAELPYAVLGIMAGHAGLQAAGEGTAASGLVQTLRATAECVRTALAQLAANLPPEREASPIDRTLDHALVTDRANWPPASAARLDAVARRLLPISFAAGST